MPVRVCPHCKGTTLEETGTGEVACTSCGNVVDDTSIVAEVTFGETSSGAAMVQGMYIGEGQSGARNMGGGLRKNGSWESREQTLANGRRRIMNLANFLSLPEFVGDAANRWFQLAVTQNFVQGRRSQYVVAACLYVACRQQQTTHMLIDFADILQVSVFAIGATYLKLVKVLQIKNIPLIDPSIYIQRFAVKLDFKLYKLVPVKEGEESDDEHPKEKKVLVRDDTRKVMNDAVRLVQRMGKDWLHQGRRPAGVAGACLLVAARMNNYRRSRAEIVHVAKVAEDTIQRRLDEFRLTAAGSLTVQQFRGTNIETEADPPSFTKHRKRELQEQREREQRLRTLDADSDEDDNGVKEKATDDEADEVEDVGRDIDAALEDSNLKQVAISIPEPVEPTPAPTRIIDDDPENLSDVDDDEISNFILNEEEVDVKSHVWHTLNAEYLREQELKAQKIAEDAKNGIVRQPRKRKRNKPKDSTSENLPETPAESAKAMLVKKVLSKKINYAAMDHLFNKTRK
ncbi:Brf1-like TBP-binding domain-containing protein [Myxozyma melibiosi]|uniref:B-related factor 1 n=1 Tax=Myxozyma melibiosi TaxID=54550 RepID=A0ABR1FBR8_9ASCO